MLNKSNFIKKYAEEHGIKQNEAAKEVERFLATLNNAVVEDGGVKFVGYFNIEVVTAAERKCVNPRTGEPMTVAAGKRVKLSASKQLKELVKG